MSAVSHPVIQTCQALRQGPLFPSAPKMANLTLLLAQVLPPSAPPPSAPPPVHDFYGSGGYCGWYTHSYAIDTYPVTDRVQRLLTDGSGAAAFSMAAGACLEKCMFDERCNALEVRGDACEYHTGAAVSAKRYRLNWPANNEPTVVSCWIKVPPGCNRKCDLTQKSEIWRWLTLPTLMVVSALMLALIIRNCKSQAHEAGGPTQGVDVEAPEAWEPPSQTMPTRIVPAGVVEGGAQGKGGCAIGTTTAEMAAGAAVAGAGAPAVDGADVLWSDVVVAGAGGSSDVAECAICLSEVEECAICLSEMGAGDLVLQLPCGHEFHLACFEGWEAVRAHAKQGRPTCPLCKADLSGSGDKQPAGLQCAEGQTNTVADTGRLAPPTALEVDAAAAATPTAAAAAASVTASSSAVAGGGHGGGHGGEPSRWSRPAAFRHLGWACSYLP